MIYLPIVQFYKGGQIFFLLSLLLIHQVMIKHIVLNFYNDYKARQAQAKAQGYG